MRPSSGLLVNWRPLLALAVLASLLTFGQHRAERRQATSLPERMVRAIARPLQIALEQPGQWLAAAAQGLQHGPELVAQNRGLAQQRDEARAEVTQLIQFYLENKRLREELGLAPVRTPDRVPARVVGLETGASRCRATLRVEQAGLIAVGDVVREERSVVGRVIRVQGKTAEVLLLIDPQAGVAARDSRSRDEGVVKPDTSLSVPATRLKMEKLSPLADLREGDLLVTSGLDEVYPPNLPLGIIEWVVRSPASAESITAVVRPLADFYRLEFVWVLKQK